MNDSHRHLICLLILSSGASGATRTSGEYHLSAEVVDAGGVMGTSASYRHLGSVGITGDSIFSGDYHLTSGYPAQTDGLPVPVLQVEQPAGQVIADGGGRDLGVVNLGTPSQTDFTLRNTGADTLLVAGGTMTGDHATDFTVSLPDGGEVPPGGTIRMTVAFHPNGFGPRNAVFSLQSNAADSVHDIHLAGTGNSIPTFAGYAVVASHGASTSISLGKLLSKAADADGNALTASGVSYSSGLGAGVSLGTGSVIYTPASGFSGNDNFQVTISDPHGATVTGTVVVTVGPPPEGGGQGTNTPQLTMLPGGHVGVAFQGIPGRSYQFQRSTDLSHWTTLTTVTAAANGSVTFTDENAPEGNAFYRLGKP